MRDKISDRFYNRVNFNTIESWISHKLESSDIENIKKIDNEYYGCYPSLLGKIFTQVEKSHYRSDDALFFINDTERFVMLHRQDCCESVVLEDVIGDLNNLIDNPILKFEIRQRFDNEDNDSKTWTFYEIATIKGSVTLRWFGSSNGYYSEEVEIYELKKEI